MPKLTPPPERPLNQDFALESQNDNQGESDTAVDEITTLRAELKKKDHLLNEMQQTFEEFKSYASQVEAQLAGKDQQVESLQMQIDLKENQLATIQSTVQSKDGQVAILKESLELKDQQIQTLNDSIAAKDQQLELKDEQFTQFKLNCTSSDNVEAVQVQLEEMQQILEQKNAMLADLQKEQSGFKHEVELLKQDLDAADALTEKLQKQLDGSNGASGTTDLEKVRYSREQIIKIMVDILDRALHNVTIIAPIITDLEELNLFEVKSSVNIKTSCFIDPNNSKHNDLIQEFESLDNVSLRFYENRDRWAISKDNDELFLAAVGKNENLVFYTQDPLQITMLNPLVTESWLRARKL